MSIYLSLSLLLADQWLSWFLIAFFLGAAAGGAVFGRLGDRTGRVRAIGRSIVCYSVVTGLGYFFPSVEVSWVLRFVARLGIGGIWPNGVALVTIPLLGGWASGQRLGPWAGQVGKA